MYSDTCIPFRDHCVFWYIYLLQGSLCILIHIFPAGITLYFDTCFTCRDHCVFWYMHLLQGSPCILIHASPAGITVYFWCLYHLQGSLCILIHVSPAGITVYSDTCISCRDHHVFWCMFHLQGSLCFWYMYLLQEPLYILIHISPYSDTCITSRDHCVFSSPDVILCGGLGSKHQLTNRLTCVFYLPLESLCIFILVFSTGITVYSNTCISCRDQCVFYYLPLETLCVLIFLFMDHCGFCYLLQESQLHILLSFPGIVKCQAWTQRFLWKPQQPMTWKMLFLGYVVFNTVFSKTVYKRLSRYLLISSRLELFTHH